MQYSILKAGPAQDSPHTNWHTWTQDTIALQMQYTRHWAGCALLRIPQSNPHLLRHQHKSSITKWPSLTVLQWYTTL